MTSQSNNPKNITNPEYIESIAKASHEMNRQWCQLLGDNSKRPWSEAPEWQKDSARAGVKAVLDGSAQSPREQHNAWAQHKRADGWVYGEVKDAEAKTHPCLVDYRKLPADQQAKDAIFRAVVEGLR